MPAYRQGTYPCNLSAQQGKGGSWGFARGKPASILGSTILHKSSILPFKDVVSVYIWMHELIVFKKSDFLDFCFGLSFIAQEVYSSSLENISLSQKWKCLSLPPVYKYIELACSGPLTAMSFRPSFSATVSLQMSFWNGFPDLKREVCQINGSVSLRT